MPELPEVTVYVEALRRHVEDRVLERARIRSPSLLKTWDPPLGEAEGRRVVGVRRIGKRVVWEMEERLFLVFHLMITGRMRWKERSVAVPRKVGLAAFDFPHGAILLTEAGTKKRASLHVVRGEDRLADFDAGGVEPLESDLETFRRALVRENRTLKRALTDPRIVSGVGNAHSDEILLRAGLSPLKRTGQLDPGETERLHGATREHLTRFSELLREEIGQAFPDRITAFHPRMEVHGRFGEPCPRCGAPIQRIVYAERETNYCPECQTDGKVLKDRAISRFLGDDWPRSLEDLEEMGLPGAGDEG